MIDSAARSTLRARSSTATGASRCAGWLLTSALALSAGAAPPDDLPRLGDTSSAVVSPALEAKIGRNLLQQVRAGLPLSKDPILKYYAETQLRHMAQHSELRDGILGVVLIDSPQINAFAAPGGVVGINQGLMLHAEDIHEYASVVAHELAHLSQRHFARGLAKQRSATLPTLVSLVAAIALGAVAGGDAGLAALTTSQAAAINSQLRYSRGREAEADRVGLNTLVAAGFDPEGMARMFERMRQAYRFTERPPEFLLSHPVTEARISDARNQIAQAPRAAAYQSSLDYQAMRARVILHYADSPEAAVLQFRKRLQREPEDQGAAYGMAIALSATGEHERALDSLAPFLDGSAGRLLFTATQAELLMAAGRNDDALNLLARQLVINPDNPPLSMLYARGLTTTERYTEAETVLTRLSRKHGDDSEVWYELAEVAGKAGNTIGVHRARAEFFAMHGALERAVKHLEYAMGLADPQDFKLTARLDARIKAFKRAKRERDA